MSEQPLVCCVMLTRDRPEMAKRAVECFRRQTYAHKRLYIVDSGASDDRGYGATRTTDALPDQFAELGIIYHRVQFSPGWTIGAIRNFANGWALREKADILCHWDDDDYSHSNRLAEQVTLLQASGADCVGYSEMLFWRDAKTARIATESDSQGEAWLYLGPQKALGTSLCYWRRTWERKPFPDQPRPGHANGEDTDWIKGLNLAATSKFGAQSEQENLEWPGLLYAPRMIASIHGANTSGSYKLIGDSTSWLRVPEFDNYCRERMAL